MDLRVLGPFELVDGGVVAVGGRRRRTLLARLALADGPLSEDELLRDLFDPPHDATARRLLKLHLDGLAELLGPGRIDVVDGRVQLLRRPGESDADAFLAESAAGRAAWHEEDFEGAASLLGGAVERWRGRVLEDLAPLAWLTPISDRLDAELTLARATLGKVELAIERHGRVGSPHGLPAGVVSFLLTDVVDSTRRWEEAPDRMDDALVVHDELIGRTVAEHGGVLLRHRGEGDSTFSVFGRAADAVAAAASAQRRLAAARWPAGCELMVRAGVHTGEAIERGGDYYGPTVNRAARIRSIAQAGWVAVSQATSDLVRAELPDAWTLAALGPQLLRGIDEPEPIYRLVDADAPTVALDRTREAWAPARRRVPERAVPLTGRADQLARLLDALPPAAGPAHVALVAGDAGIGKTRLTSELADAAEVAGVATAYGRCDDEVALPYQPLVAAMGELVTRAPADALAEYGRDFAGELTRFVPALARRLPALPPPQSADAETERHLFFDAAAGLLDRLSRDRPLLLVVDDLHWAERETLRLLRYLVESVADRPILFVLAYRSAEVGTDTPLADLLGLMRRRDDLTTLALTGLSGAEAVPLVELLTGRQGAAARHLAERVAEETGGNPLFTLELLRHVGEQGDDDEDEATGDLDALPLPESVRDVVERRVARLGPAAAGLLPQAAVMGMSFDLDVLASTADADADAVLDALEDARRAHLVEETEVSGRFTFTHALVAHALVHSLSATRQQRLHLRIADAIEELHGDGPGPSLSELATHLVAAGALADQARVGSVARTAGDEALAGLAADEAVRWYRIALDRVPADALGDRVDVLVQLGVAQRQAADPLHRETLLEAAGLADELGDADRLVASALANARGDRSRTHFVDRERVAVLERALGVLAVSDSPERARLLAQLAQETIHAPDAEQRLARADEALAMARRLDDPSTLADVLLMRYEAIRVPHTLPARLTETAELVELATGLNDPRRTAFAHMWRSRALLESGDVAGWDRHAQQAWELSEKVGSPYLRWNLISHFAHRAYLHGDLVEADRLAFECFAAGEGEPDARPVLASQLIAFRAAQDRLGEMVPAAEKDVARRPDLVAVELALAWMYAQVGEEDKATSILERHLADDFAGVRYDILWMQVMAYAAETAARLGHARGAADLTVRLRPWVDQVVWSGTIAMGPVAWLLGMLAVATGDVDAARAFLARARAISETAAVPLWSAHVAVAETAALLAAGETEAAAERAEAARALGARHGFAEIERDLRRLGVEEGAG